MAYITTFNANRLTRNLETITLDKIVDKIYKSEIYFLNKREIARLKGVQEFLKDPSGFSTKYYKPIEVKDSLLYLYPERLPSYHKNDKCEFLKSNFINFKLPTEVIRKGKDEVLKFRLWYKQNEELKKSNQDEFYKKMKMDFQIDSVLEKQEQINSKTFESKFESLKEIEDAIDSKITASKYYYSISSELKQKVIRRFQKSTFLRHSKEPIQNNDTGLPDETIWKFMSYYDETFKNPVKELLLEYYRYYHNPEMTFESNVLEVVGFRPCSSCYSIISIDSSPTF